MTDKLTDDEMRVKIAEAMGIKPRRMWRVYYDKDRQHASIKIYSREEALHRRMENTAFWKECGFTDEEFSEPEEYDEWEDAPDYLNSRDDMAEVEATLDTEDKRRAYLHALADVCAEATPDPAENSDAIFLLVTATAKQRAEAFIRTI